MDYCKKHNVYYVDDCPVCKQSIFYTMMGKSLYTIVDGLSPLLVWVIKLAVPVILFVIALSIVFAILKCAVLVPVNLGSVHIGYHYGIGQYFDNVGHFQDDSFMRLISSDSLFSTELKGTTKLKRGQTLEIKGYKRAIGITWVAVKLFKGEEAVYGYLKYNKDIGWNIWSINEPLGASNIEKPDNTENEKFLQMVDNSKNTIIAISKCNIRKKPSLKSDKVRLLNAGEEIEYSSLDSGWYKVKIDSVKFGFVKTDNVVE